MVRGHGKFLEHKLHAGRAEGSGLEATFLFRFACGCAAPRCGRTGLRCEGTVVVEVNTAVCSLLLA
jgi:hypothetical protein